MSASDPQLRCDLGDSDRPDELLNRLADQHVADVEHEPMKFPHRPTANPEWEREQQRNLARADPIGYLEKRNIAQPEAIEERRRKAVEAVFVLPEISILGQSTAIYARYGTGKTLLVIHLLREAVQHEVNGSDIYYINADDTFNGATDKAEVLRDVGIRMILANGVDESNRILDAMMSLSESDQARGKVFVLDTLKKFTNVMDKTACSTFGTIARGFIQAGGTVIVLGHSNKHKDESGREVFEGVADIVSDFDASYTIECDTPLDETARQVTFRNNKSRGPNAQTVSYAYDAGEGRSWLERLKSVERIDHDKAKRTAELHVARERREEDSAYISSVLTALHEKQEAIRGDLIGINTEGFSRRAKENVLARYGQSNQFEQFRLWSETKGLKNARVFRLSARGREMLGEMEN